MKFNRDLPWNSMLGGLILGLAVTGWSPTAKANVYATNIRINGGTTNINASPGDTITISYTLNEPASAGATIQILSGAQVVHNIPVAPNTLGTLRGPNEVLWDGHGPNGGTLPGGTYSIRVAAASNGYTNWTQITSDTADQNAYVAEGRGIAVDRNAASPYYGRVFIANTASLGSPAPGDSIGILKFNADTSDAEEGATSEETDGYTWSAEHVSPWKLEVSADDYVYVDDLANGGQVIRWDPTISSNSLLNVLRQDNRPAGAALSGPAIVGTGSTTQIWMANTNASAILNWPVTADGTCATNYTGKVVVSNTGSNLFDVALDKNGIIYTCTYAATSGDPSPRVFRYPAPANGSPPETTPDWAVGAGDDNYAGASGVAVDPTGTYVAVAFEGPAGAFSTNGNTKVLWATNGALAANLDLGVATLGDTFHDDSDCAWDAVGNVYFIDVYASRWHIYSPPGTNQASTLALASIQLSGGTTVSTSTPVITKITVSGGNVNLDFTAGTNDAASSFRVQGASTITGPFSNINATITQVAPGVFHAVFALGPSTQYFRLVGQGGITPPPSGPTFTKASISGANILLTFSGSSSDPATAFTVMSSPTANGTYSTTAGALITVVSPGVFQASVPTSGPAHFYRIRR